eukprot:scaffold2927_cov268-Chaetoceros_neogracile.AAC.21
MYNNCNDNDDNDDANALIDSYFLPGGILDPEENNNDSQSEQDENGINHRQTKGHSRTHMNHSDGTNTMGRSLDVHNTESLRSRLGQLGLGGHGQSLLYNANAGLAQPPSRNLPIGTFSSLAQDAPRVGVSGLDPTADDVVGGRPILMGATLPGSSTLGSFNGNQLPSPNIVAQNGQPLRDYNADWFNDHNTTNAQENDLSNILRGALQGNNTLLTPLASPMNVSSRNQTLIPQDRHPIHNSMSSNSNDESQTTSATSHIQRNPWSNEDLSKLKISNPKLMYSENFPESSVSLEEPIESSLTGERRPFQPELPLSHNSTTTPATPQPIRPPPGFRSTSPLVKSLLGRREDRKLDPPSTIRQRTQTSAEQISSSFQQQNRSQDDLQPSHSDVQPPQNNKITHHNDGDYDLSSLNTKSSRDIPSTIYVEEDTASTSEDTLTVCADSVTESSVPRSSVKVDSERNCMDVVEESSGIEVSKFICETSVDLVFEIEPETITLRHIPTADSPDTLE